MKYFKILARIERSLCKGYWADTEVVLIPEIKA